LVWREEKKRKAAKVGSMGDDDFQVVSKDSAAPESNLREAPVGGGSCTGDHLVI
jgi:hypothetical protein